MNLLNDASFWTASDRSSQLARPKNQACMQGKIFPWPNQNRANTTTMWKKMLQIFCCITAIQTVLHTKASCNGVMNDEDMN